MRQALGEGRNRSDRPAIEKSEKLTETAPHFAAPFSLFPLPQACAGFVDM